ncbi:hypothetical protein G7K_0112-t3 [Saitoella complicata NRRL Y-17804]|uniref:RRM domain-containing protein n=1 Tax=Saitoella complicata (strain BCRC 22490 / CBS 7301 / JCM 7358 / NBRC 10748 / NRRL Y-17804) TaxID=698492 RepID=A0A0E9N844_SAICN|nr:hypothetical protein G7K_0112-t3 [Saitoella complicata NRRL Y-17804]
MASLRNSDVPKQARSTYVLAKVNTPLSTSAIAVLLELFNLKFPRLSSTPCTAKISHHYPAAALRTTDRIHRTVDLKNIQRIAIMGPKQKGVKMSLNDFIGDDQFGAGSWADEMDEAPIAPASRSSGAGEGGAGDKWQPTRSSYGGDREGSFRDRDDFESRPLREEVPLPTKAPFTAFVGNLPWDATEDSIGDFFYVELECLVTNVRLVKDRLDDKPKGFGYVEFEDLESLKKALAASGQSMAGRNVRISVAEPPKNGARAHGDDRTEREWVRTGPLAPIERPQRQERYAGLSGDGKERDFSNWERRGPLAPRERPMGDRPPRGDREGSFERGAISPPAERRRLVLTPRTEKPLDPPNTPAAATPAASKSNPFGAARPVDSDAALKKVEEKIEQQRVAAAEAREKAKAAREAREAREAKEAKDAEAVEVTATKKPVEAAKADAREWRRAPAAEEKKEEIREKLVEKVEQITLEATGEAAPQGANEEGWATVPKKKQGFCARLPSGFPRERRPVPRRNLVSSSKEGLREYRQPTSNTKGT